MTVIAVLSGLGHTVLVMAGLLVYVLATRIGHQRRNPSAAVAWVIAMVALPYLTLPLFVLIGTRKVVRPLKRARGLPQQLAPLALADVAPAAQARGMDMGLLDSDAATVPGNAEALRMLARNLLDNAIKYTPPGGQVDLQVRRAGNHAVLTVEDSGPGIAPEHRERAMQRFVRTTAAEDGAPGSGLGLAIVQAIAQAHGATVQLDASPRLGGLRVTVRFAATAP